LAAYEWNTEEELFVSVRNIDRVLCDLDAVGGRHIVGGVVFGQEVMLQPFFGGVLGAVILEDTAHDRIADQRGVGIEGGHPIQELGIRRGMERDSVVVGQKINSWYSVGIPAGEEELVVAEVKNASRFPVDAGEGFFLAILVDAVDNPFEEAGDVEVPVLVDGYIFEESIGWEGSEDHRI